MMKRTAATPELELLDGFVGIWDTEGQVLADSSGQPAKFKGTDTYEWLPGGYFLFHRFEANMPDGSVTGIEVIGYDPQRHAFTLHSFDNRGNALVMEGQFEMENWTFVGERRLFTGGFADSGKVFAGSWEQRAEKGDDWHPLMMISLHKVE